MPQAFKATDPRLWDHCGMARPKELDSVFSRYLSNTLVYATGTVRDAVA